MIALRRRSLLALAGAALARPALTQPGAWPTERSIRYVVPVAAGGSQDIVARLIAKHLTEALDQNVLVENMPGAGSNIGYEHVARQKPDGYTLLAGSDSLSINRTLFPKRRFSQLPMVELV